MSSRELGNKARVKFNAAGGKGGTKMRDRRIMAMVKLKQLAVAIVLSLGMIGLLLIRPLFGI
jgi:hypothetical protein